MYTERKENVFNEKTRREPELASSRGESIFVSQWNRHVCGLKFWMKIPQTACPPIGTAFNPEGVHGTAAVPTQFPLGPEVAAFYQTFQRGLLLSVSVTGGNN